MLVTYLESYPSMESATWLPPRGNIMNGFHHVIVNVRTDDRHTE